MSPSLPGCLDGCDRSLEGARDVEVHSRRSHCCGVPARWMRLGPTGGEPRPYGSAASNSVDSNRWSPRIEPTPGHAVSVDYVDFVQANGIQYLAADNLGLSPVTVAAADVGPVQFRVRCALSELNRQTQQMPPPPRDGDAGLLTAGTPVHAVKGWSPSCRLAAQRDVPGALTWRATSTRRQRGQSRAPSPPAIDGAASGRRRSLCAGARLHVMGQ
jgi:hypothetical protein